MCSAVRLARWVAWSAALLLALFIHAPVLEGRVLAGRDVFRIFIPNGDVLLRMLRDGELPLWNPLTRMGEPFLAALQTQVLYPLRLPSLWLFGAVRAVTAQHLAQLPIALGGAYLFLRRSGALKAPALVGASAFALGPAFSHMAFLPNIAAALAWTGFILWAAVRLARGPSVRASAVLAGLLGLSSLAGAPEIVVCQVALVGVLVAARARQRWRALAFVALAAAWAVALAGVSLVPAAEFALLSDRAGGVSERLDWSAEGGTLGVMVGWLYADQPRGDYFERQNLISNLYVGVLATALCLLAATRRGGRGWVRAWLAGGAFFALLSLGEHFPPAAALLSIPPLNAFRYPVKYACASFSVLALASGLGLQRLWALGRAGLLPSRAWLLRGGLAACVLAVAGLAHAAAGGGEPGPRVGVFWVAAWSAAALLVLWRVPVRWRPAALAGLVLVELAAATAVLGRPVYVAPEILSRPSSLAATLRADGARRVSVYLSLPRLESDVASAQGAPPLVTSSREHLVPMRYMEEGLAGVEADGAPVLARFAQALQGAPLGFYRSLGTTHLVRDEPEYPGLLELTPPGARPRIFRVPEPVPQAFVVHRAERVSAQQALGKLHDQELPTRHTVYLEEDFPPLPSTSCNTSTAEYTSKGWRYAELEVDACAEGYLVLPESFMPGWRAVAGGRELPVVRANYLLRAVRVPAGRSRISLEYSPASLQVGLWASGLGACALLLALLSGLRHRRPAGAPRSM